MLNRGVGAHRRHALPALVRMVLAVVSVTVAYVRAHGHGSTCGYYEKWFKFRVDPSDLPGRAALPFSYVKCAHSTTPTHCALSMCHHCPLAPARTLGMMTGHCSVAARGTVVAGAERLTTGGAGPRVHARVRDAARLLVEHPPWHWRGGGLVICELLVVLQAAEPGRVGLLADVRRGTLRGRLLLGRIRKPAAAAPARAPAAPAAEAATHGRRRLRATQLQSCGRLVGRHRRSDGPHVFAAAARRIGVRVGAVVQALRAVRGSAPRPRLVPVPTGLPA